MTELGRSLIEEGIEKGRELGILQGTKNKSIEVTKIAIKKGISNKLINELTELPVAEIEEIRMAMEL
ncbi:hypothetical protein [Clostridium botulinum]|uniref:hypothetical protein n=1 Tax=Clostridium botulinum TaxID=1491 RepID=UPI0013F726BE|nr:hypothetical protein [Clostridium botulinum]MBN1078309.1 hypothetical protein [Clostridium botulinum]NFG59946.1 hypothetical protein [Clostridium botulinum]NFO28717.1 hypothetical protein [Clostridium botulinum]NFO53868.1 hypothetical protein [Clostridium botulinum]